MLHKLACTPAKLCNDTFQLACWTLQVLLEILNIVVVATPTVCCFLLMIDLSVCSIPKTLVVIRQETYFFKDEKKNEARKKTTHMQYNGDMQPLHKS